MRRVTAAGYELVKQWRPDIVLASAPPNSGLIAARRIARACAAPWVGDLRDLWADNTYYSYPRWRWWIDRLLEPGVLRSAAGLITVSPIWADMLRRKYEQPVRCIFEWVCFRGFPNDFVGSGTGRRRFDYPHRQYLCRLPRSHAFVSGNRSADRLPSAGTSRCISSDWAKRIIKR